MAGRVKVRLLRRWNDRDGHYRPGDVIEVPASLAKFMTSAAFPYAERVEPPKPKPAKKAPVKPKDTGPDAS